MSTFFGFLKLIRWSNLLTIFIAQFTFIFCVFPTNQNNDFTSLLNFILLASSTILIAAGGYIINDVFDIECDKINKPNKVFIPTPIKSKTAKIYYVIFSLTGLIFGTILSFRISIPNAAYLFIGIIILLYAYSKKLQKLPFIGNFLISVLVASNTLILLLLIETNTDNSYETILLFQFSFFAFFINLIREIIKDIQDINGDYNVGMHTLPILLGKKRTKKIIYIISIVPIYFMIRFCLDKLHSKLFFQIIYTLLILVPLSYFYFSLFHATKKKQFQFLSTLLKGILILGLLFLLIITY